MQYEDDGASKSEYDWNKTMVIFDINLEFV